MSTSQFPVLAGQGWSIDRTVTWRSGIQESASGKVVRLAYWSYPMFRWDLTFNFLRSSIAYSEMQALFGFFSQRQGAADSFLYTDQDDNAVTGQVIGIGNSVTTAFQLVRAFGGNVEPMFAPNSVTAVYLNGVIQSGGSYSVTSWGATSPGVITFNSPPGDGVVISADFSYFFPCHFAEDSVTFSKFVTDIYSAQKVSIESLK